MEYEMKPFTNEDAEYMEERIDEFDDTVLPPEPGAPEDEELILKVEDEEGNTIAAFVAMIYTWGQLDDITMWVDEAYRRQGLGSMLLREAERIAKERGCYLSLLETFDSRPRAFAINMAIRCAPSRAGRKVRLVIICASVLIRICRTICQRITARRSVLRSDAVQRRTLISFSRIWMNSTIPLYRRCTGISA